MTAAQATSSGIGLAGRGGSGSCKLRDPCCEQPDTVGPGTGGANEVSLGVLCGDSRLSASGTISRIRSMVARVKRAMSIAVIGDDRAIFECAAKVIGKDGADEPGHAAISHLAHRRADIFDGDRVAVTCGDLFEHGDGIAQAAARLDGDGEQPVAWHREALLFADELEALDDCVVGDAVEVVPLAAGNDGRRDLVEVRGGRMKTACGGGSSRVFRRALKAPSVSI